MLNGSGLRVIIFVSGCEHHCINCHNPETWDKNSGKPFNEDAIIEIMKELDNNYISGLTLSGGDPLHEENLADIYSLVKTIKEKYPNKTIWLYTGYTWEQIFPNVSTCDFVIKKAYRQSIVELCDILVDGEFVESLADVNYPWCGSTNQRVIDVKKTLEKGKIELYEGDK